ncbi:MAG TPA: HIT family protein [Rhodanobacteraceae bacterium]|nr:HIT family protein [Rhodanobacteraceae bacterium]
MSDASDARFELDPRLAADTVFVADWKLCRVLLMDDARFPWLILVPRKPDLVELDDLDEADRTRLMHETQHAMKTLRAVTPCDKFNVGALGNIVRQLHVHVVVRREGDPAWPGPVWGSGLADHYMPDVRNGLVNRLQAEGQDYCEDFNGISRANRDG